ADRESRLNLDKDWVRKKILSGEFHKYFDPNQKKDTSLAKHTIYVPKEENKDIFDSTMNAIIASEMLCKLNDNKNKENNWKDEDYSSRIKAVTVLCNKKQDFHQSRNEDEWKKEVAYVNTKYENDKFDYKWCRIKTEPKKPKTPVKKVSPQK